MSVQKQTCKVSSAITSKQHPGAAGEPAQNALPIASLKISPSNHRPIIWCRLTIDQPLPVCGNEAHNPAGPSPRYSGKSGARPCDSCPDFGRQTIDPAYMSRRAEGS